MQKLDADVLSLNGFGLCLLLFNALRHLRQVLQFRAFGHNSVTLTHAGYCSLNTLASFESLGFQDSSLLHLA